ncbi:MAG: hypothetical protein MJY45_05340 [Bacteroidales bacterium]|nr:hypothetical protein [Bacteroidales bacterium]
MKKALYSFAAVLVGLAAVSCSSVEKMAKQAENVIVKCNPEVLELIGGTIEPTVTVTYPKGYFQPKAILKVTPVIVYEGGEEAMEPLYYQGEGVKDNNKTVAKDGATITEKLCFNYKPGMEKSYLELRGIATIKKKSANLPSKKVADGLNTTCLLVKKDGTVSYKADNYQAFISQTAEGQILYTINSADVRGKELKSQSIKDFQNALDEINANERKTLKGTEVVAYASPDGGQDLNSKLSDKRAASAQKAWGKVVKGHEASDPEVKSIGQDWEGFQELVSKSDIEDKDLILRVLSMYSDPAVRESEIKNMSEVYSELKGGVLPELRRARFIANVEFKNYTTEELKALIEDNIDILDEEALLHSATLVKDAAKKIEIYEKAISKFNSARAQFNKGVALLEQDKVDAAANAFAKCDAADPDVKNAKGVIALRKGDLNGAAAIFKSISTCDAKANLGVINILQGDYAQAEKNLENACCFNKALSLILNNKLDKAEAAIKCQCPESNYLRAIIAARKGNADQAKACLEKAKACPELAKRAEKDIEFAAI